MAVPSPSDLKRQLRREARARRRAFVEAHPHQPWQPGNWRIKRGPGPGVSLASYRPVGSEADPAPIERLAADGHNGRLCYPRVDDDGEMRFYAPTDGGFARDLLGMEAPTGDAREQLPSLVLVPLLAFDRRGTRLGQGGGHYDRALARLRGECSAQGHVLRTIGIAWAVQEMPGLPQEPFDVPLDAIVTELEWIDCTR